MEVRRVEPDDWLVLRTVRLAALADAPAAFGSSYAREVAFDESQWRRRIAGSASFVAFAANEPVGIVTGIADEAAPADERHVVSMWVRADARGTGVAATLIQAVREWARAQGAASLSLWVADGNDRARGSMRAAASAPPGSASRCRATGPSRRTSSGSTCETGVAVPPQRSENTAWPLVMRPSAP